MDRGGITANRNTVPDDPRSPFVTSGVRLGTAAETTAGMGTEEMAEIASLIGRVLRVRDDEAAVAAVRDDVAQPLRALRSLSRASARGASQTPCRRLVVRGRARRRGGRHGRLRRRRRGRVAIKVGYVDVPTDRKMHDRTTPYGGGAAMFIGVCVAMAVAALDP